VLEDGRQATDESARRMRADPHTGRSCFTNRCRLASDAIGEGGWIELLNSDANRLRRQEPV
jgi:hypothetical protein